MVHFCTCPLICTLIFGYDLQAADERREMELRQKDEEIRQKDVEINRVQVWLSYGYNNLYYFSKCAFLQFMVHNNNTNIFPLLLVG